MCSDDIDQVIAEYGCFSGVILAVAVGRMMRIMTRPLETR